MTYFSPKKTSTSFTILPQPNNLHNYALSNATKWTLTKFFHLQYKNFPENNIKRETYKKDPIMQFIEIWNADKQILISPTQLNEGEAHEAKEASPTVIETCLVILWHGLYLINFLPKFCLFCLLTHTISRCLLLAY